MCAQRPHARSAEAASCLILPRFRICRRRISWTQERRHQTIPRTSQHKLSGSFAKRRRFPTGTLVVPFSPGGVRSVQSEGRIRVRRRVELRLHQRRTCRGNKKKRLDACTNHTSPDIAEMSVPLPLGLRLRRCISVRASSRRVGLAIRAASNFRSSPSPSALRRSEVRH